MTYLSIFMTAESIIGPRLKSRLLIAMITIFLNPVVSVAQINPPIQRQELFLRANKSLAFIAAMAYNDANFANGLTPEEKNMLKQVGEIITEMNTVTWFQKNKVQRFERQSNYMYAYTIFKNQVVQITTPINKPIAIQFSNDQALFNLKPEQPIRSAMTETDLEKDIYVNLNKINDRSKQYDLGSAVSILFHEYGHKLGDLKIQTAIDSCAAKLESYVRSMTNTVEINGIKISTLVFKKFNFQFWAESILVGVNDGEGKLSTPTALTVIDGEGIYAWIEDSQKVTDLTETMVNDLYKNDRVQHTEQPGYQFLRQRVTTDANLKVLPGPNGKFKLSLDGQRSQLVLPFMTSNSPRPDQYKLFQKAFVASPWLQAGAGQEFVFNQADYKLEISAPSLLKFDVPHIKIEFQDKKLKGNNLEIYYSVKGDLFIPATPIAPAMNFWPEITVLIDGIPVTLKATNHYADENEYKFVLKNFDKISNKEVKITKMQFKLDSQNIVQFASDGTLNGFLPSETTLSKKKTEPLVDTPAHLKSVQIWNGKDWVSLKGKIPKQSGLLLRFIFKSPEILRELNLTQEYGYANIGEASEAGRPVKTDILRQQEEKRSMRFTDQMMRQTLRGDFVYVDVNIDHGVKTSYVIDHNPKADEWFRQESKSVMPRVSPEVSVVFKTAIKPERKIVDIRAVTLSGVGIKVELKKELSFDKVNGDALPENNSARFRKMKCPDLFN